MDSLFLAIVLLMEAIAVQLSSAALLTPLGLCRGAFYPVFINADVSVHFADVGVHKRRCRRSNSRDVGVHVRAM
jgi:hypothetical protein